MKETTGNVSKTERTGNGPHIRPTLRCLCYLLLNPLLSKLLFGTCLLLSLACALPAAAHDPGLSTATFQWKAERLAVTLVFSVTDAGQIVNSGRGEAAVFSREQLARDAAELPDLAAQALVGKAGNQPLKPDRVQCRLDGNDNVSVAFDFNPCAGAKLQFQSQWLSLLPPGHRQFVSVRDSNGLVLKEEMISAASGPIELSSFTTTSPNCDASLESVADFVVLGVKHIWTGYDHLLFLFGLLMVTGRFVSSLKVITCFTLAHSITLAVATICQVEFPARIVEPLIAASIVYVGAENLLRRGDPARRGLLTFAFGLVHGLGFASVLKELGVGTRAGGVALPLFSFNLGVELGQVAVAAAVLPMLWKLKSNPSFAVRWMPAGSMVVTLLGGYWLVQRLCS